MTEKVKICMADCMNYSVKIDRKSKPDADFRRRQVWRRVSFYNEKNISSRDQNSGCISEPNLSG